MLDCIYIRFLSIVELHKNTKLEEERKELLNNNWPNMDDQMALRKLVTGDMKTELRNIGTLTRKFKRKWKNQLKETELRLGAE